MRLSVGSMRLRDVCLRGPSSTSDDSSHYTGCNEAKWIIGWLVYGARSRSNASNKGWVWALKRRIWSNLAKSYSFVDALRLMLLVDLNGFRSPKEWQPLAEYNPDRVRCVEPVAVKFWWHLLCHFWIQKFWMRDPAVKPILTSKFFYIWSLI